MSESEFALCLISISNIKNTLELARLHNLIFENKRYTKFLIKKSEDMLKTFEKTFVTEGSSQ